MSLSDALKSFTQKVETVLEAELSVSSLSTPHSAPDRLVAAVRYGALSGGKRLRPFLVKLGCDLVGHTEGDVIRAGAAVECIHCYSLVHDDLPDMDDDALRRGKPSVHVAFDPATAILAGDSLLTHAFGILADERTHPDAGVRTGLISELVSCAGVGGMAGGQMRDIEGEGQAYTPEEIGLTHSMKTGALIRASLTMGAMMAHATRRQQSRIVDFAEIAGRIYQLSDDILDATGTSTELGKTPGKDAVQGKSTLVATHGLDHARKVLEAELNKAVGALADFGARADLMRQLVTYLARRGA